MARFAYQGTSKDGNGRVIPSMTVSVFEAGLTTAADVYVASSGGTSVNSVTSDSTDGRFKFWVDEADYSATQQFKITLAKTGFTSNTYDDIVIFPTGSQTKEFFVPVTYTVNATSYGDFPIGNLLAASQNSFIAFKVPNDFSSITNAEIIVIPIVTQAAANWDISSDYAAVGEAYNTHSESDSATTYNVTADQLFAVDISGILSSLVANDYVGIQLTLSDADHDVKVLGVRFKYS